MGGPVRSGPRLTYGTVGAVLLMLAATTAYEYGNNLPVLQTVELEPGEQTVFVRGGNGAGVLVTRADTGAAQGWVTDYARSPTFRSITSTAAGVRLGPPVRLPPNLGVDRYDQASDAGVAWQPAQPDVAYVVGAVWTGDRTRYHLLAVSLAGAGGDPVVGQVELFPGREPSERESPGPYEVKLTVSGRWLLATSWGLATAVVDIRDPQRPALVSDALPSRPRWSWQGRGVVVMPLVASPGMSASDALRLNVPESEGGLWSEWDGDEDSIVVWRLTALAEPGWTAHEHGRFEFGPVEVNVPLFLARAEFGRAGAYDLSFVDRVLGQGYGRRTLADGFLYRGDNSNASHRGRSRLMVLDVRNPDRPRSAGHFAVPSASRLNVAPLGDGRMLAAGDKLYVLGPPAR